MLHILVVLIVVAVVWFLCMALGLPYFVAVIAMLLVLLGGLRGWRVE